MTTEAPCECCLPGPGHTPGFFPGEEPTFPAFETDWFSCFMQMGTLKLQTGRGLRLEGPIESFGPEMVSVLPQLEPHPGNSIQTNRVKRSEQGMCTSSSPLTGCSDLANHQSIPWPVLTHRPMVGWGGCPHLLLEVALRQFWSDAGRGPAQSRCSADVCRS